MKLQETEAIVIEAIQALQSYEDENWISVKSRHTFKMDSGNPTEDSKANASLVWSCKKQKLS